jgi:RNA polymerase sigma-70 factor (ECF subfamily)
VPNQGNSSDAELSARDRLSTPVPSLTSATLTGATLTGATLTGTSRPSFSLIFHEYAGYVIGLLRRLRVAEADVEDVAQEVFLTIHTRLPSFEARSTVKTWVCGICLRKASDYRRKAYRRRELPTAVPPELVASDSSEEYLMRRQQAEQINRALASLSPKQLDVFVLFEIEELPMADVARAVGCPRFTAYNRLRTARREIRAFFERDARAAHRSQSDEAQPQPSDQTDLDSKLRECM